MSHPRSRAAQRRILVSVGIGFPLRAFWAAARVEVTQRKEAEEREKHPIEEKVVDKIVERTDVSAA